MQRKTHFENVPMKPQRVYEEINNAFGKDTCYVATIGLSQIAADPDRPVVVNNAYLGLIRQSQRGFDMDYCVQLAFENVNAPELENYGVDHVSVVEGLGCNAIRVRSREELAPAFAKAKELMAEHSVPVVVEVILERVTDIAMGTEINAINEFEDLTEKGQDAPTAISLLD